MLTGRRLTEVRTHLLRWDRRVRVWDIDQIDLIRVQATFWQRLCGACSIELHSRWQVARLSDVSRGSALRAALAAARPLAKLEHDRGAESPQQKSILTT
jgi:hypothetical protein